MARITLFGAAGEVTGSAYLVESASARVLVDFGFFQGGRDDEERNIVPPTLYPAQLDAVVLTHAHMDHSGRLPLLIDEGFRGYLLATPATIDLLELLLYDSASLQESDIRRDNQKLIRAGREPLAPLYGDAEVAALLRRCQPLPYDTLTPIAQGIAMRLIEAGHMLGSTSIQMQIEEAGRTATVVFSGDIGPHGIPFLRDPGMIDQADLVFLESTYGDRDHRPLADTLDEFATIVRRSYLAGSKMLVPAFAVGRSQQILYHLAELFRNRLVPEFPIYLDSPLAIRALNLYNEHPELADAEATALEQSGQLDRDLRTLRVTASSDESRELNHVDGPCMIIAGSGMCTGGRILHHFKHNLWKQDTAVLMVGYQGEGTLGRRLIDGADYVRIYGEQIIVRASIHTLGGFSAHAGQSELLNWLAPMMHAKLRVVLTHGEDRGRLPLAEMIAERYGITALLPGYGDVIEV
jgi:metallo-beta-lactamase family protein